MTLIMAAKYAEGVAFVSDMITYEPGYESDRTRYCYWQKVNASDHMAIGNSGSYVVEENYRLFIKWCRDFNTVLHRGCAENIEVGKKHFLDLCLYLSQDQMHQESEKQCHLDSLDLIGASFYESKPHLYICDFDRFYEEYDSVHSEGRMASIFHYLPFVNDADYCGIGAFYYPEIEEFLCKNYNPQNSLQGVLSYLDSAYHYAIRIDEEYKADNPRWYHQLGYRIEGQVFNVLDRSGGNLWLKKEDGTFKKI